MDIVCGQIRLYILDDALVGACLIKLLCLHNTGAHRRHLRPESGADNSGHQMPAKCRTGHLQVGVLFELCVIHINGGGALKECLVLLYIHIQMGAVGGKAGMQSGGAAWTEIPAQIGSADKHDFRLLLLDQVAKHLGISIGSIVLQQGAVRIIDPVGSVAAQCLQVVCFQAAAQHHAAQLYLQIIGQLPAFAEQLIADALEQAFPLLTKSPYALEGGSIRAVVFSHCILLLSVRSNASRSEGPPVWRRPPALRRRP